MGVPTSAFILCGGLGTRLSGVLGATPKFLAPIGGRPFADIVFQFLWASGVREVVLGVGHLAPAIERYLDAGGAAGMSVTLSHETTPAGTAGALRLAGDHLPERFLVLNGDSLAAVSLERLCLDGDTPGCIASIALVHVDDVSRFGVVALDGSGNVRVFHEKGDAGGGWVNAGIYVVQHRLLDEIPELVASSLERDVFPRLIGRGLRGCELDGSFLDIGTPESLTAAPSYFEKWKSF